MLALEDPAVRDRVASAKAMERLNRARTPLLLDALRRMSATLSGEPFAVVKGCDYLFRLYDSPYLRQMADVDILVPRARRPSTNGFARRA